jgi:nucleoside-diphosphate-sugar epimerase
MYLRTPEKPTTVITGATGFLGSHLMAAMLTAGYRLIIFGRASKEGSLRERILKLLRWFGIEKADSNLEFVEIDFLKPSLGLEEPEYEDLCMKAQQIVHCASDTSFSERKRESVLNSNVNSLAGILGFASDSRAGFFHYVSTAYVSGMNVKICRECLSSSTDFLNVYEESKAEAENIIAEYCTQNKLPFTIIRPSVVYGDSRTGRSLRFNALYLPIQSVKYMKDIYLNDILNNEGKKSRELGIHIDKEGYLFLPLKINLPERGSLNIIPVDYFVDATMIILTGAPPGGIFHLTNNSPTRLEMISVYNEQFMKIRGIEITYGSSVNNYQRNPPEELFDRFMEPYRYYLSDNRVFDRSNTDLVTNNLQPPEFSYEIFKNCMEYAIRVNWGKSIF